MIRSKKFKVKLEIKRYSFMTVACLCYSLALLLFLIPHGIVAGGISGIATIINIKTNLNVGIIIIVLNIPLILVSYKMMGAKFVLRYFITTAVLSLFSGVLGFLPTLTENPLLAAVYAGLLQGIGIGLFVKYQVSSGGTEILGRIIYKLLPKFSIPTYIAIFDAIIVIAGAIIFNNPENVLYALLMIFISAKVSDGIIVGINRSKLCFIITEKAEIVGKALLSSSPRGITLLNGTGMYTNLPKGVLLTCIKSDQLEHLKLLVRMIDENAFVIVNDTITVLGKGFNEYDWQ